MFVRRKNLFGTNFKEVYSLKKIRPRKFIVPIFVLLLLLLTFTVANAVFSDPGSQNDPIVTLSFVEQRIEQIKYYIDEKTSYIYSNINDNISEIERLTNENIELSAQIEQLENKTNLKVVELKAGQSLICEAGTEIILRGGKVIAIASELGGLSDVTGARDIKMYEEVPPNHLLIVPRSDGRGVTAMVDAILMVRGKYEVK